MDKHKATFPEPVFKSRVLRARLLLKASGARWVWNEAKGEYVLTDERAKGGEHQSQGRVRGIGDPRGVAN